MSQGVPLLAGTLDVPNSTEMRSSQRCGLCCRFYSTHMHVFRGEDEKYIEEYPEVAID